MKPGTKADPADLQRIYDMAKSEYLSRHNTEYEPHLWVVLCYVKAYCRVAGLDLPIEAERDFYAANPED